MKEYDEFLIDFNQDYKAVYTALENNYSKMNDWYDRLNYIAPYLNSEDYYALTDKANSINEILSLYNNLQRIIVEEPEEAYYTAVDQYYEENPEGENPPSVENYETVLVLTNEEQYKSLIDSMQNGG